MRRRKHGRCLVVDRIRGQKIHHRRREQARFGTLYRPNLSFFFFFFFFRKEELAKENEREREHARAGGDASEARARARDDVSLLGVQWRAGGSNSPEDLALRGAV